MWLDGLYMAEPFLAEYVHEFFVKALIDIGCAGNGLREAPLLRIIF